MTKPDPYVRRADAAAPINQPLTHERHPGTLCQTAGGLLAGAQLSESQSVFGRVLGCMGVHLNKHTSVRSNILLAWL